MTRAGRRGLLEVAGWVGLGWLARSAVSRGPVAWLARTALLFVGVLALRLVTWWLSLHPALQWLIAITAVLGAVLVVDGRRRPARSLGQLRAAPRSVPGHGDPSRRQFLYRWHERHDLPDGLYCLCGKPRRAGELVYVGVTNALERRAQNPDRQKACWWQLAGELVGTMQSFPDRKAVLRAESWALRTEGPRENVAGVRRPA